MDYDHSYAWRWSHIKILLDDSPAHVRWAADHPDEGDTAQRRLERAYHAAVLEPDTFAETHAQWIASKTRSGKLWDIAIGANPGTTFLLPSEWAKVMLIRVCLYSHPVSGPILTGSGKREMPLYWEDEKTGLSLKARPDLVSMMDGEIWIWDLKHCGKRASEHQIRTIANRNHWAGQLAHYSAGIKAHPAYRGQMVRCGIIAFEDSGPCDCNIVEIESESLATAEEQRRELLDIIASCERSGKWPGRCTEITPLSLEWGGAESIVESCMEESQDE
jgi:hypothetical protein